MSAAARTPGPVKAYFSAFRIRLVADMQYRGAAWAGVATQFAWGFMLLMLYHAFYESGGGEPPMPFEQLASYIWLQQAFLSMIMFWWQDNALLSSIVDGSVAYELIRPLSLYGFWFVKLLATRYAKAALRCLPILLVTGFLPGIYRMNLPPGLASFGLFVLALFLGSILVVVISMFIYELTFITISPRGSQMIVAAMADFFAGSLLPIPMMPDFLQKIAYCLPFRYMVDLPFRIFSGNIPPREAVPQIGVQLIWIIGLGLLGMWGMSRAARRTVLQGG